MSIKKKVGLSLASEALGLSLIGGGTYAFFSDKAETTSTFAAGTLDLNANLQQSLMLVTLNQVIG